MQGFNMGRYRPPDKDPAKSSWNESHPLGKRAHKIDQGILVVRFELPFDIWCGSCEAHIGQGVRFNAEKRQIGKYLSTPIFAFRCKCTTCKHHFEIQTDPKNTRYVVTEGARQKEEDWDPEENGGHAVFDTEASSSAQPPDAFSHLEKTMTQAERAKLAEKRILELEEHSSARSFDPYALNFRLRSSFRVERKDLERHQRADDQLRQKIGWTEGQKLVKDSEEDRAEATAVWKREKDKAARDRVAAGYITPRTRSSAIAVAAKASTEPRQSSNSSSKLRSSTHAESSSSRSLATHRNRGSTSTLTPTAKALAARVLANTQRKTNPFG
ncbi:unnamed protein product [Tilletia laevis]|uniref:Uncharacterized protein n=2 Tax=Tilletia TaxID=13289 RepID=A0A177ULY5_9BASI|nr:hypothetical protein CF336_g6340 [Tilletia laevis]KAE8252681.1 hypothetical protein A4X03_0g6100 [Tilletia caries]KAE8201867.1 hypothetical protein CF335_g3641 [Tilletia laevis]CAD6889762.1 unnamed protein product [Tilletia caries]CAD6922342.1 unnamed protein product [Tilletia caries]